MYISIFYTVDKSVNPTRIKSINNTFRVLHIYILLNVMFCIKNQNVPLLDSVMFSPSNTLKSLNVAVTVFVDSNFQEIIPVVKPDMIFRSRGTFASVCSPDKKSLSHVRQVLQGLVVNEIDQITDL